MNESANQMFGWAGPHLDSLSVETLQTEPTSTDWTQAIEATFYSTAFSKPPTTDTTRAAAATKVAAARLTYDTIKIPFLLRLDY